MRKRPSTRARIAGAALIAAVAAAAALPAAADPTYPNRTVRIIAPVAPGGGVDLVGRTVADRLSRALGQSFIVDNQSGGGGSIASQATARAAPDGYTLMVGYVGTHGTNPAVRKLPYDAVNDFTAIAMVGGTPNVLAVNSALGVADVRQLIEHVRRNPGKVSYGSAGQGTLTHLAMEQFRLAAGIDAVHVPYRGIAPAIADLIGGQTQLMFPGLAASIAHIRGGRMRALAVTGRVRHRLLPDVPTLEELGYRGFDGVQWYGIVGPAKMPAAIVERLNQEINRALASPDLVERLSGEALEPMPMSPQDFSRYIRNDVARWTALARERRIEIE